MNKISSKSYGVAFAALLAMGMTAEQAHAALDAAVTTAITTAQTDLTSLYTALTTAGAALFVLGIIYRRFFKIK